MILGVVEAVSEVIGYCGLVCSRCSAFIATQKNDEAGKVRIAERWSKDFYVKFGKEDITCDGCGSERVSGYCRNVCRVWPCARERGVKTCAHCGEYPCEKLMRFLSHEPEAKSRLDAIRRSL